MTTMTTATVPAVRPAAHRNRVIAVTRLILTNRWTVLYLPTIILMAIFLLNLAIWFLVIAASDGNVKKDAFSYSGAIFYVFVYMLVLAVQAVSRTFPFALGYGVTRRNFALGAGLAFVILALAFSVLMTVFAAIERATGGWGINASFFQPRYFSSHSIGTQFGLYLFGLLLCLFLGAASAAVYVRWRATGLVIFFLILAVILVGSAWVVIANDWAAAIGAWMVATGLFGLAAWSLVLTAIFAVAGFVILRRATPRS